MESGKEMETKMDDASFQIVSKTSYWSVIEKKDHSWWDYFRSITQSDPLLSRILLFCKPNNLDANLSHYPFNGKIAELEQFSEDDINLFQRQVNLSVGRDRECLRYLMQLFDVTANMVRWKIRLDEENLRDGYGLSQEQIIRKLFIITIYVHVLLRNRKN